MPRLRFSLRSFFLFLFVACLIGSNLFTARENRRLNVELIEKSQTIKKLQDELGLLVVSDPAKLHAVAIPSYEATTWRWRLHVPNEGRYRIRFSMQEIPNEGIPTSPYRMDLKGGEYEFTAAIRKNHNDDWALNVIASKRTSFGSTNSKQTLPMAPEHSQWIADSHGSSGGQAGSGGTVPMMSGEPMVLLRHRINQVVRDDGSSSEVFEPCDGVMIWIVEEEQVP